MSGSGDVGIEYTRWTAGTRWVSDDGGDRKAFLFVDGAEQGTLVLRDSSGSEAVRLYVDDGTDHGGIAVSDDGGDRKALLFVDGADRGQLVLRDDDGSQASRLAVTDLGDGRLTMFDGSGLERAALGVGSLGGGQLRLLNSQGRSVATLAADVFSQHGFLTLRDDSAGFVPRVSLWVDGQRQGDLMLRGTAGRQAARLGVDDATDRGVLFLAGGGGSSRAQLWVDEED